MLGNRIRQVQTSSLCPWNDLWHSEILKCPLTVLSLHHYDALISFLHNFVMCFRSQLTSIFKRPHSLICLKLFVSIILIFETAVQNKVSSHLVIYTHGISLNASLTTTCNTSHAYIYATRFLYFISLIFSYINRSMLFFLKAV